MTIQEDERWMQVALRMAERAQGSTAENPAVGCVLVKNRQCIAQGWTQAGGRPHAETHALKNAGIRAKGATAYVTLEPCAHTGKTPPCASTLIDAGIARVVTGCADDDARVNGRGIAMLKEAGIAVRENILSEACQRHHAGFFRRLRENLPEITIKIATSKDEKITTGTSEQWLTNPHSRAYGHALRASHDAIVTGAGTVMQDDPMLNCRLNGRTHESPIRVVLDRHATLPHKSALVRSAHIIPVWLCCNDSVTTSPHIAALQELGVHCIALPNGFDFRTAMQALAQRGINRALIEGGQRLTQAALEPGIASTLYWFQAAHEIGDAGLPALRNGAKLQRLTNQNTQKIYLSGDILNITPLATLSF